MMAWYTGLAMAMMREALWEILNPWMWSSKGTGRTFGWKLKNPVVEQPSHPAMSLALLSDELSARMRMLCSIMELM